MVKEDERQHRPKFKEKLQEERTTIKELEQLAIEEGLPRRTYIQLHRVDALLQEIPHPVSEEEQYRGDFFLLAQVMDTLMQGRENTIRLFELADELQTTEFDYKGKKQTALQAISINTKAYSNFIEHYFKLAGIGCLTPECVKQYEYVGTTGVPIITGQEAHSNSHTAWAVANGDVGSGALDDRTGGFQSLRVRSYSFSGTPRLLPLQWKRSEKTDNKE